MAETFIVETKMGGTTESIELANIEEVIFDDGKTIFMNPEGKIAAVYPNHGFDAIHRKGAGYYESE